MALTEDLLKVKIHNGFSIFSLAEVSNSINKLKDIIVKKFLFAALIMISANLFAQNLKLGYVDSQVILTQFSEAIKAQGDLDALTARWSAQVDSMTLAYQQALADYQKQANTMTEEKKLEAQKNLIAQEQSIIDFRREKFGQNGEIYQMQEQIFDPVKKKIYTAIEQVAKTENMQFVFDKSGDIILLYADSAFDVTFQVLDKLKRGN
jgi:outer membrane protein